MSYPPPPPPLIPENPPGVTRRQRAPIENKRSILLSDEENRSVFEILGKGRQTLSTAVIQLLVPTPDQQRWYVKDTGVLCLVRDTAKKSYFIQVFSLKTKSMVFRQEIYSQFEYLMLQQNFITFEGDNSRVGINFADRVESADFKEVLDAKLESKRNRRDNRRSRLLEHQQFEGHQSSSSTNNGTNHSGMFQDNSMVNGINSTPSRPPQYNFQAKAIAVAKISKKKNKDKGKKGSGLRKEDIGKPMDFRHVQHVGWDPDRGFDLDGVDSRMLGFFEKAGVSRSQLEDATTMEFIYNFIEEYQAKGNEPRVAPVQNQPPARPPPPPMATQNGPPPVPIRHSPLLQHGNKAPAPPPPPTRNINVPPPPSSMSKPGVTTISINGAPPPPPPPPPPLNRDEPDESVGVNNGFKKSQPTSLPPPVEDERSALLKQIQKGVSLKKVDTESERKSGGGISGCLEQIKTGVDLKKTLAPPKIPQSAEELDGLAGALNRALAARSRAINPESSSSEDDGDDGFDEDEWE